ncbi:MAG TPA: hypothetical protein DCO83_10040 [Mucilaginibacter sp.]|jgi:hypothetical protein|nr:hypothetical protein [Mucilaginibacter sp.]
MILRYIIYITNDKNQFAGIDYYIDEKNLDYTLVLVKTVNEALLLPLEVKSCILGILLDWELLGEGPKKEDAVIHLEKEFPFTPVIVISGQEFGGSYTVSSYYQNKQVSHPSDLVEIIDNFVSFYQCDWITSRIKHLTYEIEYFGNDKIPKGKMSAYFNDDNPIRARTSAISFFKNEPSCFQINLYAFDSSIELANILNPKSVGRLVIYSDFLLPKELLANLRKEHLVYHTNKFHVEDCEEMVCLPDSAITFKVLNQIVNFRGEISLR